MKRINVNVNHRRFGFSNPHSLNIRVGYRGGIRL